MPFIGTTTTPASCIGRQCLRTLPQGLPGRDPRRRRLRRHMVETARQLTSVLSEFVPGPSGLIAALLGDKLELPINLLAVKDARLVGAHLVQFSVDRLDAIDRLGDETAVRARRCRSRP